MVVENDAKACFKNAILALLTEKKFESITISEIADRAGYNRVSFYHHFQDKYQLIDEIIRVSLDGFIKKIIEAKSNIDTTNLEQTQPTAISMFNYVYDHSKFFQLMLSKSRIPGFIPTFLQAIYDMYQGTLMPDKEYIDRELHLVYVTGATFGVISYWVTTNFKYSPTYMADQLTEIVKERPQKILFKNNIEFKLKLDEDKLDKRVVRTKTNFKDTLLKLASEMDFDNITISKICQEAKYNRATFYSHYKNKISLAHELIEETMEKLIVKISIIDDESDTQKIDEIPTEFITRLFKFLTKYKNFFEVMMNGKKIPGSLTIIRKHFREYYSKRIEIIRGDYSVEWDIYLAYITSATIGMLSFWIYSDFKYSQNYMIEQFTQILFNKPKPI